MRIRTIKPEFWMHEGLCHCSDFTRLLAIALLNWADDEGYFMANPILIRGQLFPFLDDSKKIPRSLQELSSVGWIELGKDTQQRSVGRVLNFSKHQRVDKPKPSEIKASSTFQDESKNDLGSVQDESKEEGNGKEGNGKEGNNEATPFVLPFDSPSFAQAWNDWIAHNKAKRKTLPPTTIKPQLQKLKEMGEHNATMSIRQSIENNWTGLFPPKTNGSQKPEPRAIDGADINLQTFRAADVGI